MCTKVLAIRPSDQKGRVYGNRVVRVLYRNIKSGKMENTYVTICLNIIIDIKYNYIHIYIYSFAGKASNLIMFDVSNRNK